MNAPALPFDNSYARLPARFYARLDPTPVRQPGLLRVNRPLCAALGIDAANNPQALFDGTFFDGFIVTLGGVNLKLFSVGTIKLEYGFVKMKTIGDYAAYEDLYDIHIFNTQFSVAF